MIQLAMGQFLSLIKLHRNCTFPVLGQSYRRDSQICFWYAIKSFNKSNPTLIPFALCLAI